MIKLYGINNCDSVRKAKKWFLNRDISIEYHDFRKDGLTESLIHQWCQSVDISLLINRRSTTWKQLSDSEKNQAESSDKAISLLAKYPTLIKRPVINDGTRIVIGYNEPQFETLI